MKVYVTQAQFARISELKLRLDTTENPDDYRALVGQLSAACLDNGGDFNPNLAQIGVPTRLIVVDR